MSLPTENGESRKKPRSVTGKSQGECNETLVLDFSIKWEGMSAGGGSHNPAGGAEPEGNPLGHVSPEALGAWENPGE